MGLCISYSMSLSVSADVTNSVCLMYKEEGVVFPSELLSNAFITAAVDNIDHKTSSTTSLDYFHGTTISLSQHPREGQLGIKRDPSIITGLVTNEKISHLPAEFTNVHPAVMPKKDSVVPLAYGPAQPVPMPSSGIPIKQKAWLENVRKVLDKSEMSFMSSLPCQSANICSVSCHSNFDATFHGKCTYTCHDQTYHGCCKDSHSGCKSWSSSCVGDGSTSFCP